MSKTDRVRACYQHCCLMYVSNRRMSNQSLRERFGLRHAGVEGGNGFAGDRCGQGRRCDQGRRVGNQLDPLCPLPAVLGLRVL